MPSIQNLISRAAALTSRDAAPESGDNKMVNLMIVVVALVFFALLLAAALLLFRRMRRQRMMRDGFLPVYSDSVGTMTHQGLTIKTTQNGRASVLVINRDGQPMLANPTSAPHSPDNVPEIHITFPDEHDEAGRQKNGRVVVVRVGDGGVVGLEPVREEPLPAYEKDNKSQFYSVDMNDIGGLREKDRTTFR